MSGKEIHFIGLLANTDSSIPNVTLDHAFKIHAMSEEDCIGILSNLEGLPHEEVGKKLFIDFPCLNSNERKFYSINNSFESDNGSSTELWNAVARFENKFVHSYLDTVIQLMRLFKEGNICMPLKYYYFVDNNTPKVFIRKSTSLYISPMPKYTLESSETSELQKFIQNTKLPFEESFLQLAFGNFELSYQIHDRNLSFLSVMISLETLFNPGLQELRYRVSRNAAVLLGKEKEDSKTIFSEIKGLYDKRSKIVHTGNSNTINEEDLLKLRHYVRESIKEINKIDKNKDELLEILNSCGFGERSWTK